MKKTALILILAAILPSTLMAQGKPVPPPTPSDTLPGDTIYYDGTDHSFLFAAPLGWVIDTTNAYFDGYTAAMFPANESYFNATKQIFVWVLDLDSLTFEEFITADSLHLHKTKKMLFRDRYPLGDPNNEQRRLQRKFGIKSEDAYDTTQVDTCIVLEINDPGGVSREAGLAYFNAGSEIVIFQLNISERFHVGLAQRAFEKVLKSFKLTK